MSEDMDSIDDQHFAPVIDPSWEGHMNGPTHNRFPGLNNFDLGMRFMKEGVYRPFLLYVDLSVL